jgi:large subunit ribosomal protein L15
VNLEKISSLKIEKVNANILHEKGAIKKTDVPVKILGNGDIKDPVEITADMFSKSAIEKLEKAGGKAIYK